MQYLIGLIGLALQYPPVLDSLDQAHLLHHQHEENEEWNHEAKYEYTEA
jgi:hypothetical protein